jgi:catechol 2,3-dioxygenase-like lactoylglutathione lyase family enzyme
MKLSHVHLWVLDQDAALDWYTNTLGWEVREDVTMEEMGGMRWLTVGPPEQPELEFMLIEPGPPPITEDTSKQLKTLLERGALGGVIFQTDDCRADYERLSKSGVEFTQEPNERFYGVDAAFRDPFGNAFRLVQPSGFTSRGDAASPAAAGA